MKSYNTEFFEKSAAAYGITLSEHQLWQFMKYYELLTEWNSFMNLTAITEFDEVILKHFLDSITLGHAFSVFEENVKKSECGSEHCDGKESFKKDLFAGTEKLIDIGTGAGFPGIPLKIVYPNMQITLLDSLNKRVQFLDPAIAQLGLSGIETIHGRAEDFSKPGKLREQYDLCVSRAVANLSTLSEYCLPYVKVGGYFVPYKSEKTKEEIHAAQKAVNILGGKIEGQVEFCLADTDIYRNLIFICKREKTPGKYPRKSGLPAKEPIT